MTEIKNIKRGFVTVVIQVNWYYEKNKYDFQNLHDRDLVIWMIRNMSRTLLLGIIKTIFISI